MKLSKNILIGLLSLLIVLSSCTTSFRISAIKPAEIDITNDVKKILVVNNTMLYKKKDGDIVEGILTGEQIEGDKRAATHTARGLAKSLLNSNRYNVENIRKVDVMNDDGSINWKTIEEVCREHEAQLMVTVDYFDSDAPIGGTVVGNALGAGGTSIEGSAYFSIYYPAQELLIQQYRLNDVYHIPTSGSPDPLSVITDAARKNDYTKELGYNLGYNMGSLMYPNWVWVNRKFYGSGSKGLRHAKRMIKNGNWDLAQAKLEPMLQHHKAKVRGRATYNLALVHEGQGNLQKALELAKDAAFQYDVKLAYDYINILENRIAENQQLQLQEEN